MIRHRTDRGVIHEARAEDVYGLISPGSVQLIICDGPYFLSKAAWDMGTPEDAAGWYRPHIAGWGVVCAPSASVYVWGTSASWAAVHPEMLAAGWGFRGLIVWDKVHSPAQMGAKNARGPLDITEVCGCYTRQEGLMAMSVLGPSVWRMAEQAYRGERLRSTTPTPDRNPKRGLTYSALHPCQKPLTFVERFIRASSEPGALVLSVFSGTCREAIVCESLSPSQARRYVCVEVNNDGVDYLAPVIEELEAARGQAHLFGQGAPDPLPVVGQQVGLF